MSASIKEALAALYKMVDAWRPDAESISKVRDALEAAEQEAEAWDVINSWQSPGPVARVMQFNEDVEDTTGGRYVFSVQYRHSSGPYFEGATRLEALTKAGAWCRAELAK